MRILLIILLLSGCAASTNKKPELGYWLDQSMSQSGNVYKGIPHINQRSVNGRI